jgi:hypothetical protein
MQVQVNSDNSVAVDATLAAAVESTVSGGLERFAGQISRVEIHLSDANAEKSGSRDKRCLLEARIKGQDPVAVTDEAATEEQAVQGATRKMDRLLSSRFGRLEARGQ